MYFCTAKLFGTTVRMVGKQKTKISLLLTNILWKFVRCVLQRADFVLRGVRLVRGIKITGPPLVMCDPVIQLSLLCELPYSAITRLYARISRTFCQSTNGRRTPSSNRIGQPSAQSSIYIFACTLTDEVHDVCSGFSFTA